MAGNDTAAWLTTLLSTTDAYREKSIVDNVFDVNPILRNMLAKRQHFDGGYRITVPVELYDNSTVGGRTELQPYNLTQQDPIRTAEYPARELSGETTITGWKKLQNAGQAQIISYLDTLIRNLEKSIQYEFETQFFGSAASDVSTAIVDWTGINHFIDATKDYGSQTDVVGGLDRNVYATWNSNRYATASTFNSEWDQRMLNMLNSCRYGMDGPTTIVTTQAIWENLARLMTSKQQYNSQYRSNEPAYIGFETIFYHGIPVWWSRLQTSGYMHFIDEDGLVVYSHSQADFVRKPVEKVNLMDAWFVRIMAYGNFCLRRSRTQGVILNIS